MAFVLHPGIGVYLILCCMSYPNPSSKEPILLGYECECDDECETMGNTLVPSTCVVLSHCQLPCCLIRDEDGL